MNAEFWAYMTERPEGRMDRRHFYLGPMTLYVRRVERARGWCLDIASVDIEESYRGKGIFRLFLGMVEDHHTFDELRIECVGNERLHPFLLGRGYSVLNYNALGRPETFFKRR